jgi:hypothetical protein
MGGAAIPPESSSVFIVGGLWYSDFVQAAIRIRKAMIRRMVCSFFPLDRGGKPEETGGRHCF